VWLYTTSSTTRRPRLCSDCSTAQHSSPGRRYCSATQSRICSS
jgi:hypothetical protein